MEKFKSFIYLDNKKMYSLASQMFEGLVESYIERERKQTSETEEQKAPIGSGRKLADVISTEQERSENKFLHDYLYNNFEQKLIEMNKVEIITEEFDIDSLKTLSFVKVRGKAIFNDSKEIMKSMKEFNKLGDAIAFLSLYNELKSAESLINDEISAIKDRNQKAKVTATKKTMINQNIKKYIEDNNLNFDQEFIDKLIFIMEFGLDDTLEVQIKNKSALFSTILDRKNLKEEEKYLIGRYSRLTEVDITLFGYVTQTGKYLPISGANDMSNVFNFKDFFHGIVNGLMDVENIFIGKSSGEVIVDPIAIYVEL